MFVSNLLTSPDGHLDLFIFMHWSIWIIRNDSRFRDVGWDPGDFLAIVDGLIARCATFHSLLRHQVTYRFRLCSQRCSVGHLVLFPDIPLTFSTFPDFRIIYTKVTICFSYLDFFVSHKGSK